MKTPQTIIGGLRGGDPFPQAMRRLRKRFLIVMSSRSAQIAVSAIKALLA